MTINGYLTLGWLEEDDPSRGFFRVRPAALLGDEPVPYKSDGEYGPECFLRIVPDKNEMSSFKTRMRGLGSLCLIDLRGHSRENDKIRSNKNFTFGADKNPFMIYSDVIRELPASVACEIISDPAIAPNRTGYVYLQQDNKVSGPYKAEGGKLVEGEVLSTRLTNDIRVLSLTNINGDTLPFMIDTTIIERDVPQRHFQNHTMTPRYAPHAAADNTEAPTPAPESAPAPEAPPAEAAAPTVAAGQIVEEQPVVRIRKPQDENELPYALRLLKDQIGLNPRKGRSLAEVVDEQWRVRKIEQLGQQVPSDAPGEPVESPAQRAVKAVNEAWAFEGARAPMLQGIIENSELVRRLYEVNPPQPDAPATDARMIELESERLKLKDEIDGLAKRSREMKAAVLRELVASGEADAEALRNSAVILQQEIDERTNQLEALDKRREELSASLERVLGGDLTDRLTAMLAQSRLGELIKRTAEEHAQPAETPVTPPVVLPIERIAAAVSTVEAETEPERVKLTPDELIDRLSAGLRQGGWEMRRNDIVHALTVLALNRPLILTGYRGGDDMAIGALMGEILSDETLCGVERLNAAPDMPAQPVGRRIVSILDHPYGYPIKPAYIDAGFLMLDVAQLTLPTPAQEYAPLDPASIDAFGGGALSPTAAQRYTGIIMRLREYGARISHGAYTDGARYIAAAADRMSGGEAMATDYAIACRILPLTLTNATDALIQALPDILKGMPECARVLRSEIPLDRDDNRV